MIFRLLRDDALYRRGQRRKNGTPEASPLFVVLRSLYADSPLTTNSLV
jgi:hypothetical protein